MNRGGTPLNKQEMRNALYQGNATKLLKRLRNQNLSESYGKCHFIEAYERQVYYTAGAVFYLYWNKEMLDEKGNNIEYRSDMEEFLGAGMQLFNRIVRISCIK